VNPGDIVLITGDLKGARRYEGRTATFLSYGANDHHCALELEGEKRAIWLPTRDVEPLHRALRLVLLRKQARMPT